MNSTERKTVLVTGGAGYIGSVAAAFLIEQGLEVVVIDNLSQGHLAAVHPQAVFYQGNISDAALINLICQRHGIEAVLHFAASALVGESMVNPAKYYLNNVVETTLLLNHLLRNHVNTFILSSTAATYGIASSEPITEECAQNPINPYGRSKWMIEQILRDFSQAYPQFHYVALRYFNACGAWEHWGEHHDPETHLIPNLIAAIQGEIPHLSVYGNDYPTADGTCVRDYIHVRDLASAHFLALQYLWTNQCSDYFNLGNSAGFSIAEVIQSAERVIGRTIPSVVSERRPGDPPVLVASSQKARHKLGWSPAFSSLDTIISDAWQWSQAHPRGYPNDKDFLLQ